MAHHYSPLYFQRVEVQVAGGKTKTYWGTPINEKVFRVTDKEGTWTGEFFIGATADYLERRTARLNLHYGELEVV